MTWLELVWGLLVAGFSAGLSWVVARRTIRTQVASDAHVSAVNALLPTLGSLRALLHEAGVRQQEPHEVARAITTFEETCLQHQAALPRSVSCIRGEVRAAIGNYLGAASLAAVDARVSDYPLADFDPYWQEILRTYLGYVMSQLQLNVLDPQAGRMRWRPQLGQTGSL